MAGLSAKLFGIANCPQEAAKADLKATQSRSPARPPGSTPAPPLSRAHSLCESRTPLAPFSRAQSLGDSSPADGTLLGADLDWDDDQANLSFVSTVKTTVRPEYIYIYECVV